jgi:hypothetical protein
MATDKLKILVEAEVAKAIAELRRLDSTVKTSEKSGTKLQSTFAKMRDFMQGPIAAFNQIIGVVTKAASAFDKMVMAAADSEKSLSNLRATLLSTGGVSGMSLGGLQELAEGLAGKTLFEHDQIIQAESVLLTFKEIGQKAFPVATKAAADMATVMGMDLQNAMVMVGKALNEPITGVSALRRVGVQLTDSQEAQIKKFMEVNDVMSAQNIILGELESQFGGAAESAATTATGIYQKMKLSAKESEEAWGRFLAVVTKNAAREIGLALDDVTKKINLKTIRLVATNIVSDFVDKGVINLKGFKNEIESVFGTIDDVAIAAALELSLVGDELRLVEATSSKDREKNIASLKKQQENLRSLIGAIQDMKNKESKGAEADKKVADAREKAAKTASDKAEAAAKRLIEIRRIALEVAVQELQVARDFSAIDPKDNPFADFFEEEKVDTMRMALCELWDAIESAGNLPENPFADFFGGAKDEVDPWKDFNDELERTSKIINTQIELATILKDAFKTGMEAIGKDLVDGEKGWKNLGRTALDVVASILEALGAQMAAQAGVALTAALLGDASKWGAVVTGGAGAAAAYAGAGMLRAIPMAEGGSGVVDRPTLFLAGDKGPEPFAFGGAHNKRGMGGHTFNFYGSPWAIQEAKAVAVAAIAEAERGW